MVPRCSRSEARLQVAPSSKGTMPEYEDAGDAYHRFDRHHVTLRRQFEKLIETEFSRQRRKHEGKQDRCCEFPLLLVTIQTHI